MRAIPVRNGRANGVHKTTMVQKRFVLIDSDDSSEAV
jgi:hypothetical protein